MHAKEAHPSPSPMTLIVILVALMLLLGLTTGAAFIDFDKLLHGRWWSIGIALFIAVLKAALVVVFFMHVKFGSRTAGIFAMAGFVWLMIMIALVSTDYLFR